jgi:hypothetical protein
LYEIASTINPMTQNNPLKRSAKSSTSKAPLSVRRSAPIKDTTAASVPKIPAAASGIASHLAFFGKNRSATSTMKAAPVSTSSGAIACQSTPGWVSA